MKNKTSEVQTLEQVAQERFAAKTQTQKAEDEERTRRSNHFGHWMIAKILATEHVQIETGSCYVWGDADEGYRLTYKLTPWAGIRTAHLWKPDDDGGYYLVQEKYPEWTEEQNKRLWIDPTFLWESYYDHTAKHYASVVDAYLFLCGKISQLRGKISKLDLTEYQQIKDT